MQDARPTGDVRSRRFRNRAIDCLELVQHQALDANGLINWWEDWREAVLGPPHASSLSNDEREALLVFDRAWDTFAAAMPNPAPPISELVDDEAWQAFQTAAAQALVVFCKAGRSPEDESIA